MQATAERAMDGGFWQNSDSELKLKNRCTGSTKISICHEKKDANVHMQEVAI